MKLYNDVTEQLQKYYLTRDYQALQEIMRLVTVEEHEPELQEDTITVPDTLISLETLIDSNGFLRIDSGDADFTGPIIVNKLVRVFSKSQEKHDGCMVLMVALNDDEQIILVPSGGS